VGNFIDLTPNEYRGRDRHLIFFLKQISRRLLRLFDRLFCKFLEGLFLLDFVVSKFGSRVTFSNKDFVGDFVLGQTILPISASSSPGACSTIL
jgi:hypothetical protein